MPFLKNAIFVMVHFFQPNTVDALLLQTVLLSDVPLCYRHATQV